MPACTRLGQAFRACQDVIVISISALAGHAPSSALLVPLQRDRMSHPCVLMASVQRDFCPAEAPTSPELPDGWEMWFSCSCCSAVCSVFLCETCPGSPSSGSSLILRAQESFSPCSTLTTPTRMGPLSLSSISQGTPVHQGMQPNVSDCSAISASVLHPEPPPKSSLQPPNPCVWRFGVSFLWSWAYTLSLSRRVRGELQHTPKGCHALVSVQVVSVDTKALGSQGKAGLRPTAGPSLLL